MKLGFLFLLLIFALSPGVWAVEVTNSTTVRQTVQPIRTPQPAYYENGRPVYINVRPVKPKCLTDEIYNKQLKKCEKLVKTKD